MRAYMLEAPEHLLAERRRTGADKFDEVWEGVLHLVPPPLEGHQEFENMFFRVVAPIAESKGLLARSATGLFRPGSNDKDYRVPDSLYALPSQRTRAGFEGAELVVEVL